MFQFADSVELALNLNEEKLDGRELRVQRLLSPGKKKKFEKQKGESTLKTIQRSIRSRPSRENKSVKVVDRSLKQVRLVFHDLYIGMQGGDYRHQYGFDGILDDERRAREMSLR